jgi:hypothetical protein
MRFWDTSAVVPLLVGQPVSALVDRWFAEDPALVLWTLTPVEIASATGRLRRDGVIGDRQARDVEKRAGDLVRASHVVIDVEAVKGRAVRLLRLHALRAADALQLGAALEWAAGDPGRRVLHTFDARLARAALREGFEVLPEPDER